MEKSKKEQIAKALYDKKLKAMVDADYATAPPSDNQQGDKAGVDAYNNVVPEINNVLKAGSNMMSETERQSFMKMNSKEKDAFLKSKGK
jgi:hypothetical protein